MPSEDSSPEEEESELASHTGLKVEHRDNDVAPQLYILTAEANELTDWAEVPRANPDFMDGYQRQLEESRLEEIKRFLQKDVNIIPGAILVTVDEEYLTIEEDGETVDISIKSPPEKSGEELLQSALDELYSRLNDRGKEYVDSISEDDDESGDQEGEDETETDDEEDSPVSYLARKTGELKEKVANYDDLDPDEQDLLDEYAERMNTPGLIIDGQHRVHGAKKHIGTVEYPIVLIPGLEEREQVYHFYIINDKADPISQEELLITVATALSEKEAGELWDRLIEANVDVEKARFPYVADVEEHSPFYQMVNYEEKVGEQTGAIDFGDLHMLMERFIDMKGGHKPLYENLDKWSDADDEPNTRYRIEKFYTFWTAIKEHYTELWQDAEGVIEGNKEFDEEYPEQFFQKDAMRVFQEYILEELVEKQENRKEVLSEINTLLDSLGFGGLEELIESVDRPDEVLEEVEGIEGPLEDNLWENIMGDDEVFKSEIDNILDDIPERFFRLEWQTSGMSTNEIETIS